MDDRTRGGNRGGEGDGSADRVSSSDDPASQRRASDPTNPVSNDQLPDALGFGGEDTSAPDENDSVTERPASAGARAAVARVLSGYKLGTRHARQVAMRVMSAAACTESRVLIDGASERVSSSDRACETHREQISKSRDTIAQTRALIRRLDQS